MSIRVNSNGTWKDVTGGGISVTSGSSPVLTSDSTTVSGKIVSWYKYGRVVMLVIPDTGTKIYFSSVPRPITDVRYVGLTDKNQLGTTLTINTDGTMKFSFYEHYTTNFDIKGIFTYTYISLE